MSSESDNHPDPQTHYTSPDADETVTATPVHLSSRVGRADENADCPAPEFRNRRRGNC